MWYNIDEDETYFEEEAELRRSANEEVRKTLRDRVADTSRGVALFGCVPPPAKLDHSKLVDIAYSTADIIQDLNPDGAIVYDIQDEPSRNGKERPFPFLQTHEPRTFGKLLKEKLSDSCEPIIYRAMIPGQTKEEFERWMKETIEDYKLTNFVLVGGSSASGAPLIPVHEAASSIIHQWPNQVFLGGITIPERHRDRCDEHQRNLEKTLQGVGFFTSQVVYNADNSILLLQDYDRLCKEKNLTPVRMVFTFAPFGSEGTCKFLQWLGVEIPEGTIKRVLSRPDLKSRIEESMQICWENFKRILDSSKRLGLSVPLGVSVESVSKSKMELKGATDLFRALRQEMDSYYGLSRFSLY